MKKAFLQIVVSGTDCESVIEELRHADLGHVEVLAQGDISVSDKDLSQLQNYVWLHEPDVTLKNRHRLRVVVGSDQVEGRWATQEELAVMKEYGVCVEVDVKYLGTASLVDVCNEAIQSEVGFYGFDVASVEALKTTVRVGTPDPDELLIAGRVEQRWYRIAMPSWFSLVLEK